MSLMLFLTCVYAASNLGSDVCFAEPPPVLPITYRLVGCRAPPNRAIGIADLSVLSKLPG